MTVIVPAAEIAALPSALRESWGAGQRIKPEALVDLVILVKVQRAGA